MNIVINDQYNTLIHPVSGRQTDLGLGMPSLINCLLAMDYDLANPPLANWLSSYHGLPGKWVIMSPVYWEASHNEAFIRGTTHTIDASQDVSPLCFEAFSKYLQEAGLLLHYHNAHYWLLNVDNAPALEAKSPYALLDMPLKSELASLDKTLFWQKLITESQMFFAAMKQTLPFNGVWCWSTALLEPKSLRVVCASESMYPLLAKAKISLSVYGAETNLKHADVLVVDSLDLLTQAHQKALHTMPLTWYWNNTRYIQKKPSLFDNLKRLFHVN